MRECPPSPSPAEGPGDPDAPPIRTEEGGGAVAEAGRKAAQLGRSKAGTAPYPRRFRPCSTRHSDLMRSKKNDRGRRESPRGHENDRAGSIAGSLCPATLRTILPLSDPGECFQATESGQNSPAAFGALSNGAAWNAHEGQATWETHGTTHRA